MKRETLRHPKLYDLCARLGCGRPEALGYLTLLWDFVAEQATQGDVGKWSDGAIARACDWEGDPATFIQSLMLAGWIDADPVHRLLIHDWEAHCERWVKAKLEKLGLPFADRSTVGSTERSTEDSVEASPPRDQTEPNQPEPNQPEPLASVPVFGSQSKARKSNPLGDITLAELQDVGALLNRHRYLANLKLRGQVDTDASRLAFVAEAIHALAVVASKGGDPVKLFCANLKHGRRYATDSEDEQARRLLNEHRRKSNGHPPDFVTAAANRLAVEPLPDPEEEFQ